MKDRQIGVHKVLVWDAATRLFHWLTVALVIACYVSWRMNWMDWHSWTGEALLALVLFRLLWAFFGSETARFSTFLASPRAAALYLADLVRREPDRQIGHNPVGGWMVLYRLRLIDSLRFLGFPGGIEAVSVRRHDLLAGGDHDGDQDAFEQH